MTKAGRRLKLTRASDIQPASLSALAATVGKLPLPPRINERTAPLMPYGAWQCADGREVLFNRGYRPILERRPGADSIPADPDEWIEEIVTSVWFYGPEDSYRYRCARRAHKLAVLATLLAISEGFAELHPLDTLLARAAAAGFTTSTARSVKAR